MAFTFNVFTGTFDVVPDDPLTVADGGTGLTTIAAGSVLAANSLDTLSAITSTSALKVLKNNAGTVSWNTVTGTGDSVMATSPTFVTDCTSPLIYGGTGASGTLQLQSTSNSTRGTVNAVDRMLIGTALQAFGATTGYYLDVGTGNATITTGALTALRFAGTVTVGGNSGTSLAALFNAQFIIKDDGTGRIPGPAIILAAQPTYTATVAAGLAVADLAGIPGVLGLAFWPSFNRTGAGTGTVVTAAGLHVGGVVASIGTGWTVTNFVGVLLDIPGTLTGTMTNFYGIRNIGAAAATRWFLYESGGMQSSHLGKVRLGSNTAPNEILDVTGVIRTDQTAANALVATILGSVGPTGANTTVQEWFKLNINGTTRYIPCF